MYKLVEGPRRRVVRRLHLSHHYISTNVYIYLKRAYIAANVNSLHTCLSPSTYSTMRAILSLRLLAGASFLAATFAQGDADGFVCPADDFANTQCKGPKDCLYPSPDSCGSYISCEVTPDGQTARPFIQDCPDSLQWNDNAKMCDYPENTTCGGAVEAEV